MAKPFDNTFKDLAALDPAAFLRIVRPDLQPVAIEQIASDAPADSMSADCLLLVTVNDEVRLLQLEFQRAATASVMHPRLVEYAGRLWRMHGIVPEQHVIGIGADGGRLSGESVYGASTHRYTFHPLWEISADAFRAPAVLLPLVTLARPEPGETRTDLVISAFKAIADLSEPTRRQALAVHASVLASVYLSAPDVATLMERYFAMAFDIVKDTAIGRHLFDEGLAEGRAQGEAEGHAQGEAEVLVRILELRLGRLEPTVVARVHGLTKDRLDALVDRIDSIETTDDLAAALR